MGMTSGGIIYPDPADVPSRQDLQTLAETAQTAITAAPYAKITSIGSQNIPNTSTTQVIYGGVAEAHPGSFTSVPDQLTAPTDGIYQLAVTARFDGASTGTAQVDIRINGGPIAPVAASRPPFSGGNCSLSMSALVRLAAGDAMSVHVFQNSGGAVDATTNGAGNTLAAFRVRD